MSYRKLKADYLFDGFKMLSGVVLVIASDGTIESVLDEKSAGTGSGKIFGHAESRLY